MKRKSIQTYLYFAFTTVLLLVGRSAFADEPSVKQRFQQEMREVEAHIRWKGTPLTDEARFALSALGVGRTGSSASTWTVTERGVTKLVPAENRLNLASALKPSAPKEYFGLWLSLLLDPGANREIAFTALERLKPYGEDLDSAITGVLGAPEKAPLLPGLQYAASDALVWRASPRLAPTLFGGAEADDRYLRSRSILGLGYLAYQPRGGREAVGGIRAPARQHSVSSAQRRLIEEQVERALSDSSFRVRRAAATAIALLNWTEMIPRLQKLVNDPASIQRRIPGSKDSKEVEFPVRQSAAAALVHLGMPATAPGGVFSGKELRQVLRGAKDVTKDRDGLRFQFHSGIPVWDGDW